MSVRVLRCWNFFGTTHRLILMQAMILIPGTWLATNVALAVLLGQLQSIAGLSSINSTIAILVMTAIAAISYVALSMVLQPSGRRLYLIGY